MAVEGPLFERLSAERTGINFIHRWSPLPEYEHLIDNATAGGGVCLGDYDSDGQVDLYMTRPHGGGRLYRNLGSFEFQDVTEQAGLGDDGAWSLGATFVDIDNDGDLDLYVCRYDQPNRLYINRGNGTFLEKAQAFGLDFSGASMMMAFADYDLDGDLDGYLLTNRLAPAEPVDIRYEIRDGGARTLERDREVGDVLNKPDGTFKSIIAGQFDHLYRNNGNGTFSDVSAQAGIDGNHLGLSATWWDFNHDGWSDLYVANDFWGPDHLYLNHGNGTFSDVAREMLPHTPWYSMGADAADINNDGLFDFMSSDMASTTHYKQKLTMGDMEEDGWFLSYAEPRQYMRNAVYLNTGTHRFMEIAQLSGLANTDWTWTLLFGDLDNDGWIDLFVSNGMTRYWFNTDLRRRAHQEGPLNSGRNPVWMNSPQRREANLAFRNLGQLEFRSVGEEWGLDQVGVSFGAAMADLDRDGDLDLVVNNFEEPVGVYRNRSLDGHRVLIRLKGTSSNRNGVGAMLRLHTTSGIQVRYLTLSHGFLSAAEPVVHFGLGEHQRIDRLTIQWPSGQTQAFEKLVSGRLYTITEPDIPALPGPASKRKEPLFAASSAFRWVDHVENDYDDYARQPLLPGKLSQFGPGVAVGDVDRDGREDVYIGGAAGQPGMLYLNEGGGHFSWGPLEPFMEDRGYEDMAPLFFDADLDGDADLYVVSGGVECEAGDAILRDRLYLNDGKGHFTRAPEGALPNLRDSGSIVTAGDFDRDGDLDLFVGSRSIPGEYPLVPKSRLLRNDQGWFIDVSDQVLGLQQTGLVTSAVWSDADADGWIDLLVTHEWAPVKLYHNDRGKLVERTSEAGLEKMRGWWNGIAGRDLDGDADMDYVVTNFGLNSKYHASPEKPVRLYYGDFEGTGTMRLVEANYEGDLLYPVRGRSCSSNAIPTLTEKFPTFKQFALASLTDIYTPQCLADAQRLEATVLDSGVLINDGQGRFGFRPLPRLAQASPGFGVVLEEVDGDGWPDIYLVQNLFSRELETGHLDGGVSLLLMGRGDGTFRPVWPDHSGLVVPGDAKGLSAVDLNQDGWVDFLVSVNDGELLAFENQAGRLGNGIFRVRLEGRAGNLNGVGSRVTVYLEDGSSQTAEVQAGGSYLSQSSGTLVFGLGRKGRVKRVEVSWPDGEQTEMVPLPDQTAVSIRKPSKRQVSGQTDYQWVKASPGGRRKRTLQVGPEYAEAHNLLGTKLRAKGRLDRAIKHYRRALEVNSDSVSAHYNLGLIQQSRDDPSGAAEHFEAVLRIDPDQVEAHYGLGRTFQVQGKLEEAIDHYREVLRINPDHFSVGYQLGLALQLRGRFKQAIRYYQQSLKIKPQDVQVQLNLGGSLAMIGRLEEALQHFREAVRLEPRRPGPLVSMAWILATHPDADIRDASQAIDLAQRADKLNRSQDPVSLDTLAAAYAAAGQFERAVGTARSALALASESPVQTLAFEIRKRLELYQQAKPYQQPGP